MSRIQSLVYRELMIKRKNNIFYLICMTVLSVLSWAMVLFMRFSDGDEMQKTPVYSIISSLIFLVLPCIPVCQITGGAEVFISDVKSGWLRYSDVLPVTTSGRMAAEFAGSVLSAFPNGIISLINIAGFCAVTELRFGAGHIAAWFALLAFLNFIDIPNRYFIYQARKYDDINRLGNKGGLCSCGLMLLAAAVIFNMLPDNVQLTDYTDAQDIFSAGNLVWLIPLSAALMALRFYVSCKALKKTEPEESAENTDKAGAYTDFSEKRSFVSGFAYKELKQNRKSLILLLFVPLISLALTLLMDTVFHIIEDSSVNADIILNGISHDFEMIRILTAGLGIMFVTMLNKDIFSGDDRKIWAYFISSVPSGVRKFIFTKYIFMALSVAVYSVSFIVTERIMIILRYCLCSVRTESIGGGIVLYFFFFILLKSVLIPMMLRFGAHKGSIFSAILIIGLGCVFVAAVILILASGSGEYLTENIKAMMNGERGNAVKYASAVFCVFSSAAFILSALVSEKLYIKGTKEYDK